MLDIEEHDAAAAGSERNFGLVFAGAFAIFGIWPLIHSAPARWWAVAIGVGFAVVALLIPSVLKPLNVLWFKLGMLLGRIVNPIVMGLIFFLVVSPTALVFKLLRKDLLSLGRDSKASSYWIVRDGGVARSMKDQF
jgi:hypothetical protein